MKKGRAKCLPTFSPKGGAVLDMEVVMHATQTCLTW